MFVKKSILLPIYSLILYFLKKYNSFTIKKFGLFNGVKYLHLINRNNANELIKEKKLSSLPLMICSGNDRWAIYFCGWLHIWYSFQKKSQRFKIACLEELGYRNG